MKLKMFTSHLKTKRFLTAMAMAFFANLCYAQPVNDSCAGAIAVTPGIALPCSSPVSGTTTTATMSATTPSCGMGPVSDVWYSFVAGNANYQMALSNVTATNLNIVDFAFGVAVYSGTCSSLTEEGCGLGFFTMNEGDQMAQLSVSGLTVGNTYYVQVWSDVALNGSANPEPNEINFDLCISTLLPPPNDFCSGAIPLVQGVAITGNNTLATNDTLTGSTACGSVSNGIFNGLWYTATPTVNGNLTIASCGSTFDTYLKVFSGGSCSGFTNCNGFDDNGCSVQSTVTFAAVAGTTYYILLAGTNDGNTGLFTIQASGVALPVEMDMLAGKIITGNRAQLSWNTYTEQNNSGFEVQRSADGKEFSRAGFVASKGIKGNSNERIAYAFIDPNAIDDIAFYRLKQTDRDGKENYSNIISLGTESIATFNLVATPNPVKDRLSIKTYGKAAHDAYLLVTDMSGKVLQRVTVATATTDVDMSALTNGIYLLKYIDADRAQTFKISKQ